MKSRRSNIPHGKSEVTFEDISSLFLTLMWKGIILQILERYLLLLHCILVKIVVFYCLFMKIEKGCRCCLYFWGNCCFNYLWPSNQKKCPEEYFNFCWKTPNLSRKIFMNKKISEISFDLLDFRGKYFCWSHVKTRKNRIVRRVKKTFGIKSRSFNGWSLKSVFFYFR